MKNPAIKTILFVVVTLLEELTEHPYSGTGKPEALKHSLHGLWSRRISREHRVVYQVLESAVVVHSAKGHYGK